MNLKVNDCIWGSVWRSRVVFTHILTLLLDQTHNRPQRGPLTNQPRSSHSWLVWSDVHCALTYGDQLERLRNVRTSWPFGEGGSYLPPSTMPVEMSKGGNRRLKRQKCLPAFLSYKDCNLCLCRKSFSFYWSVRSLASLME